MNVGVNFKPSNVRIDFPLPFIGTFGRVEYEASAAILVMAMEKKGDEWGSVTPRDCGEALKEPPRNVTEVEKYFNNPFVRLDFDGLVRAGFAEWGEGTPKQIRFTDKGQAALALWREEVKEVERGSK